MICDEITITFYSEVKGIPPLQLSSKVPATSRDVATHICAIRLAERARRVSRTYEASARAIIEENKAAIRRLEERDRARTVEEAVEYDSFLKGIEVSRHREEDDDGPEVTSITWPQYQAIRKIYSKPWKEFILDIQNVLPRNHFNVDYLLTRPVKTPKDEYMAIRPLLTKEDASKILANAPR